MAKTQEQLLKKSKERRQRLKASNAALKTKKNWYPTTDQKSNFVRATKKPRPARLNKNIQPGQVLIILSGRFRGRRVVFLKQLPSGLLLVTGPYKLNGVPLKRVNQAYVIATKTRVNLGNVSGLDNVSDDFFKRVKVNRGNEAKDFFENPADKKARITDERRNAQNAVDTQVLKSVKEVAELKEYLKNRFALKNGDRPHLMNY